MTLAEIEYIAATAGPCLALAMLCGAPFLVWLALFLAGVVPPPDNLGGR